METSDCNARLSQRGDCYKFPFFVSVNLSGATTTRRHFVKTLSAFFHPHRTMLSWDHRRRYLLIIVHPPLNGRMVLSFVLISNLVMNTKTKFGSNLTIFILYTYVWSFLCVCFCIEYLVLYFDLALTSMEKKDLQDQDI